MWRKAVAHPVTMYQDSNHTEGRISQVNLHNMDFFYLGRIPSWPSKKWTSQQQSQVQMHHNIGKHVKWRETNNVCKPQDIMHTGRYIIPSGPITKIPCELSDCQRTGHIPWTWNKVPDLLWSLFPATVDYKFCSHLVGQPRRGFPLASNNEEMRDMPKTCFVIS